MDPTELAAVVNLLRSNDVVALARSVMNALETMRPIVVPPAPVPSDKLCKVLDGGPCAVPEELSAEFEAYRCAMLRRHNAREENARRVRSCLWAEQCLREHNQPEHVVMRKFNRDQWGLLEPAAADIALRWAQAQAVTP